MPEIVVQVLEVLTPAAVVVIILGAVWLVARGAEVRLVLFSAAILLAALHGDAAGPFRDFFAHMVNTSTVVPICCSLGFAQVVKSTECDRHLVALLLAPIRKRKALLIPGVALAAFIVNIPIVSQTGTAATIGPIAFPLMASAGIPPLTAASTLVLGASIGGELVNSGGPEYGAVLGEVNRDAEVPLTRQDCVRRTLPTNLVQFFVAVAVFWWLSRRDVSDEVQPPPETDGIQRPNLVFAAVPLLPLVFLFLTSKPWEVVHIPSHWLATEKELERMPSIADSRLIGLAMVLGSAVAGLVVFAYGRRALAGQVAKAFFQGAGYAYAEVISLIVVAYCFAQSVKDAGAGRLLDLLAEHAGPAFVPVAVYSTAAFAYLCGSGIAATQGLFPLLAQSAANKGFDVFSMGSITVLGSAAGRTASPVAAVTLLCSRMANVEPWQISRSIFLPILAGLTAAVVVDSFRGSP
jgi:C4-dicarboxylate transporter, DcuC family